MPALGLEQHVVDPKVHDITVARFRDAKIPLPTFAQLADPRLIPANIQAALTDVDPDTPHPLNLFRVHWFNDATRRGVSDVPAYIELPTELTGVKARIVLAIGQRFPMIHAHKVLAAYGCLAPRLVTGQLDPTRQRAVWPSTGNYCRGGLAISRIMGTRGVAVLPEGMSQERFAWLEDWATDPATDIIRTPGSESNVKEIYDACNDLDRDPQNIIFNQFCEFGNHLVHWKVTGQALSVLFTHLQQQTPGVRLAAYVSATGSAGTLAAGDRLKDDYGARIVAVEALECPTLLYNGFGEHNIQGIGDKHLPYIHNAMNTDLVVAVSEQATDGLGVLFNTDVGRAYLESRRGLSADLVAALSQLGLSSICNTLAAIKTAKHLDLGPDDVILTVATDGYEMYGSERDKALAKWFPRGFDNIAAAETWAGQMAAAATDNVLELTQRDKDRIFNLGYFTWVEQQGVGLADFKARQHQSFWRSLRDLVPAWDALIDDFNAQTGALSAW
ncbi:MAG: pyridoxal-5'-phosphate-dependent protein subunit beta [Oligoflexia bacterium]|nr:pyridoxal-5'-phosphate-dependent protein subunit beta [Oligoflexia bacterium]